MNGDRVRDQHVSTAPAEPRAHSHVTDVRWLIVVEGRLTPDDTPLGGLDCIARDFALDAPIAHAS